MRVLSVSLLFVVAALAGCADVSDSYGGSDGSDGGLAAEGSGGSSGSSPALGSASVYVQDAPTHNFTEVHVVFTQVMVHVAGGSDDSGEGESEESEAAENHTMESNDTMDSNDTMEGNDTTDVDQLDDEGDSGWIVLVDAPDGIDIDLLNVTGTRAAFLGEQDLLAGKYTQIRINASEAYGIDADGNRTNISLANSMLKIVKSFDVEVGMESRILIDIDLDKSLHQQGKGGWKMTPKLGKAVVDIVDDESSGEDVHQVSEGTDLTDIGGA